MKKGFTLIELLGVIIVLGIIGTIITPLVASTIKDSEDKAYEEQVNAIETAAKQWGLENIDSLPTVNSEGYIPLDTLVSSGKIQNTSIINPKTNEEMTGCVKITYNSEYNQYEYKYDNSCTICKLKDGTALAIGSKYECTVKEGETQIFYVLEDNGAKISLIMDRNIGNTVAWCNDENLCKINGTWNNSAGPITANNYLKKQTSSWTVSAELPTRDQIYKAAGNKENGFPLWLYDYLDGTTNNVSGVYGYWTSTLYAFSSSHVLLVKCDGSLPFTRVDYDEKYGVRPVITISKFNLSNK